MKRNRAIPTALAVAMTALVAAAPLTQADPGRAIFGGKGNCFSCHGGQGQGSVLGPDLTDDEWVNFDARPTAGEVETLIREGVAKPVRHPAPMPPMGGARLSGAEIAAVAAYVLRLSESAEPTSDGPTR